MRKCGGEEANEDMGVRNDKRIYCRKELTATKDTPFKSNLYK